MIYERVITNCIKVNFALPYALYRFKLVHIFLSFYVTFSLALYIDKRIESNLSYNLPQESQEYEIKIGAAPLYSGHDIGNFVGSMKKFIYYRSTKYNQMVRGDGKCV